MEESILPADIDMECSSASFRIQQWIDKGSGEEVLTQWQLCDHVTVFLLAVCWGDPYQHNTFLPLLNISASSSTTALVIFAGPKSCPALGPFFQCDHPSMTNVAIFPSFSHVNGWGKALSSSNMLYFTESLRFWDVGSSGWASSFSHQWSPSLHNHLTNRRDLTLYCVAQTSSIISCC